jgi:hypothetical protein
MDPTKHKLWQKHVQFIKGNSVGEEVVKTVGILALYNEDTA